MTGTALETYTLTNDGDIHWGQANYLGIVKEICIGKSAAKILNLVKNKVHRLSRKGVQLLMLLSNWKWCHSVVYLCDMSNHKEYKIYCLKHPETGEIRYVGVTTCRLSARRTQHWYNANHPERSNSGTRVSKWIRSIGIKPDIELLEIATKDNWEEREKYWISKLDNLTNLHEGGQGVVTKAKRSTHSIQRSSEAKYVKVVQLDNKGNFIAEYDSIKHATEAMGGKSLSSISNVLNQRTKGCKTAFGYQWFRADNYYSGNYKLRDRFLYNPGTKQLNKIL